MRAERGIAVVLAAVLLLSVVGTGPAGSTRALAAEVQQESSESLAEESVIRQEESAAEEKTARQESAETEETVSQQSPASAIASEEPQAQVSVTNPLYAGEIGELPEQAPDEEELVGASSIPSYSSVSAAAKGVRAALAGQRMATFAIHLDEVKTGVTGSTDEERQQKLMRKIIREAMRHTGRGDEGDYLLFGFVQWTGSIYSDGSFSDDKKEFTGNIWYRFTFFLTAGEEQKVESRVKEILTQLGTAKMDEVHKVVAIYDYVTSHVAYDYEHESDGTYLKKYTAYAALFGQKKAVCQGYSVLLYQMLLDAGVDNRIIRGKGNGVSHSWNIVRLGSLYYNVDSTWDAQADGVSPNYYHHFFLRRMGNFAGHVRDAAKEGDINYTSGSFNKAYPMSGRDYPRLSLSASAMTMIRGESGTLTALVLPATAAGKTLVWTSSAPKVAQVSGGKVTALRTGTATVTAKSADGLFAASCQVSVQPFCDVPVSAYYAAAVDWALTRGITGGTGGGKFSPDQPCTRAQIVTFLWKAAGSPAVSGAVSFTDVPAKAYYVAAVCWAFSKGITSGTDAAHFSPNQPCTRAQAVTLLWKAAGSPAVSTGHSFTDVPSGAYYAAAVRWAASRGVTSGTGAGKFSPEQPCTRAQIISMLWRSQGSPRV